MSPRVAVPGAGPAAPLASPAPGAPSFTAEQQAAIDRRDGPLFLEAAAGSGKTSVLVERFVRTAREDDVPVERILAITFTEKAAAELRARVRARFTELGDGERARAVEGGWVSTIHGFCARLLRAHALTAGIDPEFTVLDEDAARRLAADAFEQALTRFLAGADGPARLELVAAYRADGLERMLRTVHGRLRSRGRRTPRLPEPPAAPALADAHARLFAAAGAAERRLAEHGEAKVTLVAARARLGDCLNALAEVDAQAPLEPWRLEGLRPRRGTARELREREHEEVEQAHADYLRACGAHRAAADLRLLGELFDLFAERYAAAKRAASALDFEDLELAARDLLRDDAGLREDVRGRFAHVMVDEFQDTNPLQNELLDLVADGNLFAVGDEFQSIYRFRHADVEVFRARRAEAAAAGCAARLSTNFRSEPEILDAVSLAFGEAFGDGYRGLRAPARDQPAARTGEPLVELLLTDANAARWEALEDPAPFGRSLAETDRWRAAEARLLARRVAELVESGAHRAGDVAVLVRASTDVAAYERALAECGLPTYVAGGGGYGAQQQVADLRAYLAALANPLDEVALASALASPLAGVSLDALVLARLRGGGRPLWRVLQAAFGEEAGNEQAPPLPDAAGGLAQAVPAQDRERLERFVRWFERERRDAPRRSLEALVDRAVSETGYDRALLSLAGPERRMANVRKLMRLAREFEARAGRDLRGFLDLLAEREDADREGEAPLAGEALDAVRLMSIHAAKGLEFPVVCVADLGRRGRHDDAALRVADDGRVGLRLAGLGGERADALDLAAIKREQAEADEQEERRVLYVAATRARRRLILSGATDAERWPAPRTLGAPACWLWRAFAPGLADEAAAGAEQGVCERTFDGRPVRVAWRLLTPASLDRLLPTEDRAPAAPGGSDAAAVLDAPPPPPLRLPAAPGGVDRLSYSSLEAHARCGYRFFLERIVGMRPVEEPPEPAAAQLALDLDAPAPVSGLPALVRGAVAHELLERVDPRRPRAPGEGEVAARVEAHGEPARAADVRELIGLVRRWIAAPLRERAARAPRTRVELPFAFALDPGGGGRELLIEGALDLHCEEPDGALVVDFKTDRLGAADPEALCAAHYGVQRLVYALAALRAGAPRVEVAHVFLERPDEPASIVHTAGELPALEARLRALAADLAAGRFAPSAVPNRALCGTCPGRAALCSWPAERTAAPAPGP